MSGLERLDNRVPPTLDRRRLLETALDKHDCRRITPYADSDHHYAFYTVDSLMRQVEVVAQPDEGRLWSHGDQIDEALCPGGTWVRGRRKTYVNSFIQEDLRNRIQEYCE